ncbi:unnamed protein product [Chrysoparadoxa australica]
MFWKVGSEVKKSGLIVQGQPELGDRAACHGHVMHLWISLKANQPSSNERRCGVRVLHGHGSGLSSDHGAVSGTASGQERDALAAHLCKDLAALSGLPVLLPVQEPVWHLCYIKCKHESGGRSNVNQRCASNTHNDSNHFRIKSAPSSKLGQGML